MYSAQEYYSNNSTIALRRVNIPLMEKKCVEKNSGYKSSKKI